MAWATTELVRDASTGDAAALTSCEVEANMASMRQLGTSRTTTLPVDPAVHHSPHVGHELEQ
jgi:hypothetical protein